MRAIPLMRRAQSNRKPLAKRSCVAISCRYRCRPSRSSCCACAERAPLFGLRRAETKHRLLGVGLARPQNRIREGRMIRRVGEMLGLEAQPGSKPVNAALAGGLAVHEV